MSDITLCANDPRVERTIRRYLPRGVRRHLHQFGVTVVHAPRSDNNAWGWTDYSRMPENADERGEVMANKIIAIGAIAIGAEDPDKTHAEATHGEEFEQALEALAYEGPENGLKTGPGPLDFVGIFGFYRDDTKVICLDADHADDYTVIHELGHAFVASLGGDDWLTGDTSAKKFYAKDEPSLAPCMEQDPKRRRSEWFADAFARFYGVPADPKNPVSVGRDLHPETRRWLGRVIAQTIRASAAD